VYCFDGMAEGTPGWYLCLLAKLSGSYLVTLSKQDSQFCQ
jgi:hypothetical protein